jgi:hypothetical protein
VREYRPPGSVRGAHGNVCPYRDCRSCRWMPGKRATRHCNNDPFDRLLVAQTTRLGLMLLTADRSIRSFGGVAQLSAR